MQLSRTKRKKPLQQDVSLSLRLPSLKTVLTLLRIIIWPFMFTLVRNLWSKFDIVTIFTGSIEYFSKHCLFLLQEQHIKTLLSLNHLNIVHRLRDHLHPKQRSVLAVIIGSSSVVSVPLNSNTGIYLKVFFVHGMMQHYSALRKTGVFCITCYLVLMRVLRKGNFFLCAQLKPIILHSDKHAIIHNDRLQVSDEQEESSLTTKKRKQSRKGKK